MSPDLLVMVADRFRSLAEPARLLLLSCLREREKSVSELVEETGLGQANVSKHLRLLLSHRFVSRRKEGLHVFYSLADESVFALCEIVCGGIQAQADASLLTVYPAMATVPEMIARLRERPVPSEIEEGDSDELPERPGK